MINIMTVESHYVVDYFKKNKLSSLIFKHDDRQFKKLEGIADAIKDGFLTAKKQPLSNDYVIRATNKLIEMYRF